MPDPFFEPIRDGQWNACVGKQGDALNYVDGYLEAAKILADAVIDQNLRGKLDTLALPILYNVRHGLELALKFALGKLVSLELAAPRPGAADHDIGAYWQHLQEQGIADRAARNLIDDIRPFVESLARIDNDGQELRYFENRRGERSLGDLAIVNLPHIRKNIAAVDEILTALIDRVVQLVQEHNTGTRTARCSRSDLREIARMVGRRETWHENAFAARKDEVKRRFGMGSAGFSDALKAIEASRELAATIGIETPLRHLRDEEVITVVDQWLKVNPPPSAAAEPRIVSGKDFRIEMMRDDMRAAHDLDRLVVKILSHEAFADLQTIFYIGREAQFGEEYDAEVDRTSESHHGENRLEIVHHILSKLNFLDCLIWGLRRVGRPSLADQLAAMRNSARSS